MNLAVLGGGSWGTALAIALAPRAKSLRLWMFEPDLARQVQLSRENPIFLKGHSLPEVIQVGSDLSRAVEGADVILGVMPSAHARSVYRQLGQVPKDVTFVSATKGIERGTLVRMSEVMSQELGSDRIAVLSGPSFAREVAAGEPCAIVVAAQDLGLAAEVQERFATPTLRLYSRKDVVGVEVGAALKNVIAIAAGVCKGLGLGSNTHAALVTRGLAEITRLAVAMGGEPETLAGLAGLGDLVLTCGGDLSRNRKVGLELAAGIQLADILRSKPMVAEGVETCQAALDLGRKYHVDLPIVQQMAQVLHEGKPPRQAIRELMERSLKSE